LNPPSWGKTSSYIHPAQDLFLIYLIDMFSRLIEIGKDKLMNFSFSLKKNARADDSGS